MTITARNWGIAATAAFIFSVVNFNLPQHKAVAQSAIDPYVLYDRLNRLEQQFFDLKSSPGDSRALSLQPKKFDGDATSEAALSLRISDIEEQMRALNGKIEEMSFQVRQLTDKFTRFSEDVEFRFQELKTPSKRRRKQRVKKTSTKVTSKSLGTISTKSLGTIPANSNNVKLSSVASAQASTGSARGDYNRAFDLMKRRKYGGAEAEFKAFLSRHPKSALGGNAQYWLGETYFARTQHKKAADAFLRGYTRFRSSAKAPDSLLKLGITLARLGQKEAACSAFDEMRIEFPRAPRSTRDRVQVERQRVGC